MAADHKGQEHVQAPAAPAVAPAPAERVPAPPPWAGSNRAAGEALSRMGDGILPGGVVHPEVATAIATARGGGHGLPTGIRDEVAARVGDPLDDVRIHTDSHADDLARSVSARAFTTGTDVFFAAGEYQPSSASGRELIAHELTHVAQQRGATTGGPLTVSEPGDAIETQADEVARDVAG